ncbi:MAG TPA: NAD+ synthase [Solirubrobacteraceae bacterium]|nr:NAD+ synthase [Solirubrobacteraceae bacterium]
MSDDRVLRLALCQMNATVGDIAGNERKIAAGIERARDAGAQLVVFPELAITGYPPEDLLLKDHFLRDAAVALDRLALLADGIVAVVGFPERADAVYNSAAVLADGSRQAVHRKVHLPNYGVFDERRYFAPGSQTSLIDLGPHRIGLTVCEDVWQPGPPASTQALGGARLIVNLSASPYHAGKGVQRELMFGHRAREDRAAFAFCGLVGGQDELVFDGHSFVLDSDGHVLARAGQFVEELLVCELDLRPREDDPPVGGEPPPRRPRAGEPPGPADLLAVLDLPATVGPPPALRKVEIDEPIEAEIYAALALGLRDYVEKNGFLHVVLGLSGGVDSALVACIAVDALGADRVTCVVMPSPYSSTETQADARTLAGSLGVELLELEIAPAMAVYDQTLAAIFAGRPADLAEENIQARIRGNLLMALSNKFGWLVLTTGNKSEMSVGYSTLYGDSAGGFAVIKDCEKTLVYRLAHHRGGIPHAILDRPPSAELRTDQRDDDTLPGYDILDAILRGYVEEVLGRDELIKRGLPAVDVDQVIRLVDAAEYKRRQAPPGIKITERAFGRDRRMPITNRYRG